MLSQNLWTGFLEELLVGSSTQNGVMNVTIFMTLMS